MSSANGSSTSTGSSSQKPHPPQSDTPVLQSNLSQDEPEEVEPDVLELLRRLEAANGIATGVESRLDEMIGNLDELLGDLEPGTQETIINHETTLVRQGDKFIQEEQATVVTEEVEVENREL